MNLTVLAAHTISCTSHLSTCPRQNTWCQNRLQSFAIIELEVARYIAHCWQCWVAGYYYGGPHHVIVEIRTHDTHINKPKYFPVFTFSQAFFFCFFCLFIPSIISALFLSPSASLETWLRSRVTMSRFFSGLPATVQTCLRFGRKKNSARSSLVDFASSHFLVLTTSFLNIVIRFRFRTYSQVLVQKKKRIRATKNSATFVAHHIGQLCEELPSVFPSWHCMVWCYGTVHEMVWHTKQPVNAELPAK